MCVVLCDLCMNDKMYFERAHAKSQILCISKINVSLLRQASWMYSTFNDCELQIDLVQVLIIFSLIYM